MEHDHSCNYGILSLVTGDAQHGNMGVGPDSRRTEPGGMWFDECDDMNVIKT